ncbi:MAG: TrkA family potassium uptake protein [Anaerolineaceae bacterium]|jgi:trk system potassium uptake protein TrkA|nr:TrkA family potassium uptake protein [Anaerolineaceae bacterium]MDD4043688.1 TrkA family potassium uptake protein [Anaerolineaceae bacterium]MDD4578061.1 TrkA family potassium uptake protein [Anaerolineaceae bacterium]
MKIIIIGCGRVGSGLAKQLSLQGIDVSVIDNDPETFKSLGKTFNGKTYVGMGFDQKVLIEAGIEKADALAAVTTRDEVNLVAARMAKTVYKVPSVAARVYEPQKAKIYRRLGIQTVSPVTLGIERLASMLVYSNLNIERSIGTGQVVLLDIAVTYKLVNKTLLDVNIPGEIQVVALTRNGKTSLVNTATVFQLGDLLHLFVTTTAKEKVSKLLRS